MDDFMATTSPISTINSRCTVMTRVCSAAAVVLVLIVARPVQAEEPRDFPPGWLPVRLLDDDSAWSDFRKIDDQIHLYLPRGDRSVRGVFVCFVFHSGDPRELARLWDFALVTVPWPLEYDLGHNDKRSGRYKLGHPTQDMGLLLRYLEHAAEATMHPELKTVPLVGWLGQNGSHMGADLNQRAPQRVLAWSDSFPNRLRQYPELTQRVPFAFAWEISKKELNEQARAYKPDDQPVEDLSCRANTYGFDHGIYSKFNFFMAYLDSCIALRMPDEMPPPGQPVRLKPVAREQGWVGDFDPISQWNPIAHANSDEAKAMKYPVWMPSEYAAWMWRSYHSANPDVKLTGPVVEYRKKDGKWGGPECGLGYGGYLAADTSLMFSADATGQYEKIEFHSGHKVIAEATGAPWKATGVQLAPGLHALFAVGVTSDGHRTASRPAFAIVK
jgi:hypothetical protein